MTSSVFHAVADPHRRDLLDALRERGEQSLTSLCQGLPITRQAVSKHLTVLEHAGLVRVRTEGRRRMHRLDAEPLRDLADWLGTYSAFWMERLNTLETRLREPGTPERLAPLRTDPATETASRTGRM